MKIKSKNADLKSKKVNLPLVGVINLDENNVSVEDLSEKDAEFIVEKCDGWSLVKEKEQESDKDTLNKYRIELLKKSMKDLQDVAITSGFDLEEIKDLKKVELVDKLLSHLK